MNSIFFDTEFIEGVNKPIVGKTRHFIDLISIGMKAQNGNEYYAISTEFSPNDADDWVKENVIAKLPERGFNGHNAATARLWKTNEQIAADIRVFVYKNGFGLADEQINYMFGQTADRYFEGKEPVQFYSYYADYDWTLLCSLFGKMIHLPNGFPKYCLDIKQMMVESGFDKKWKDEFCPEPDGEHDALVDARWHKKLYDTVVEHRIKRGIGK